VGVNREAGDPNAFEMALRKLVQEEIQAFFGLRGPRLDGANLKQVDRLAAAVDSALFAQSEFPEAPQFANPLALLTQSFQERKIEGLILEFGVFSGRTLNHIAGLAAQTVYGFDSFEGLPEDWRADFPRGSFRGAIPTVAQNAELVVGYFDKTLPDFLRLHEGPISFLHIDCDIYSSTRTIFDECSDRLLPGAVIVFDEFFNYVGWRRHEYKAFMEFVGAKNIGFRYLGYVPSHQQVAVMLT
jgi:hypothetical protein